MPEVRKFPMNGYADTCIGYGNAADGGCDLHGTDEDIASHETGLCSLCEQRLLNDSKPQPNLTNGCPTGYCTDHTHGSRYYDCLCCYGD